MLVIPLKVTKRYDIGQPLATYIDTTLGKKHGGIKSSACRDDLLRISSLRNCISDAICSPDGHAAALSDRAYEDCMEYHASLAWCENVGFPVKDGVDSASLGTNLCLSWDCAFEPKRVTTPVTRSNIRYERACVLFNVGALQSYLAYRDVRSGTKDAYGKAMKKYLEAASTFQYLRSDVMSGSDDINPPVDLTPAVLLMCEDLLLSQGQLCAYEIAKDRPQPMHSLLSKIAAGAADMYDRTLTHSQDPVVKAMLHATSERWGAHVKTMSMLYRAKSEYHDSIANREKSNWGVEIARLSKAEFMLSETLKFGGKCDVEMNDVLHETESLQRRVLQRKEEAIKDNRELFRDKVPDEKDLVPIGQQLMVSKVPPLNHKLEPSSLPRVLFAKLA